MFLTNEFAKKYLIRNENNTKKYHFLYLILIMMTIVVHLIDQVALISRIKVRYIWIVLLIFFFTVITIIFLMDSYINSKMDEQRNIFDQKNQKDLKLYLINLEVIYGEMYKLLLRLEFNNQEENSDVKELLKKLNDSSNELKEFKYIDNSIIKGLIFSKYLESKSKNIVFKLEISKKILNSNRNYYEEAHALEMLLDNAINSATETMTPGITVTIKSDYISDNYLIVYTLDANNCRLNLTTINQITNDNKNFVINLQSDNNKLIVSLTVKKTN